MKQKENPDILYGLHTEHLWYPSIGRIHYWNIPRRLFKYFQQIIIHNIFSVFGLVSGTMREVNSLEQLAVVLEYVQLTTQSGESGLEPDVDCEYQQTT